MKATHRNNKILTGIPRSGTTLACRLLCQVPDVIAMNEPLEPNVFPNREATIFEIKQSFAQFRLSLLKEGKAQARTKNGELTDNAYDGSTGKRKMVLQRTPIYFDKALSPDFDLILKHNAGFSLMLPEILDSFPCFAMIRNPFAILNSWNSVNVPVSRGKVAKSKKLLPAFHQKLETIDDLLERQLFILSWYFNQFTNLSPNNLIRYEELIESNGQILQTITGRNYKLHENLRNKNYNPIYDQKLVHQLGSKLLKSEGAYWEYYTKSEVEKLLETYLNEQ